MTRESFLGTLEVPCKVTNIMNSALGKTGNEISETTIFLEMEHFPKLLANYLPTVLKEPKEFGQWLVSEDFSSKGGLK